MADLEKNEKAEKRIKRSLYMTRAEWDDFRKVSEANNRSRGDQVRHWTKQELKKCK